MKNSIIEVLVEAVVNQQNSIKLWFWLAIAQKIKIANEMGCYRKHCNYVIDRNECMYEIKKLRSKMNDTNS
jgi:hypothetical protein